MSLSQSRFKIISDGLLELIADLPDKEQGDWLFLSPHPSYPGRWYVDCLEPNFFYDFEEIIGRYRTIAPIRLEEFLDHATKLEYSVVFSEDPAKILDAWGHLDDHPPFKLNSNMSVHLREKGMEAEALTVDQTGMLPFQLRGFNYLRNPSFKSGLALWSTGLGKTALMAALIKQHLEIEDYELALCIVKSNNKIDTQRKLEELGDIDSFIIDGTKEKRIEIYEILDAAVDSMPIVAITNYEKFRNDEEFIAQLVTDRKVVVFWDEMPTKLSNRQTMLYDSVRSVFYDGGRAIYWDNLRPRALRQYDLTASPLENNPVGLLNQLRLLDPDIYSSIGSWEKKYVAKRNRFSREPEEFKNLDEFGLAIDFMTHRVNKKDPEIAKMFPDVHEIVKIIDWHPKDRVIYDRLQEIAKDLIKQAKEDPEVRTLNGFQLMAVMQMLCDAPSIINVSAQNRLVFEAALEEAEDDEDEIERLERGTMGSEAALILADAIGEPLTNENHEKIKWLRETITETHRGEKIVIFSRLGNSLQPILMGLFEEWGVKYVVYRGTSKQRLEAKDRFRSDPDIQIFLSSDTGSDSIDLPEASVAINYDEPLSAARRMQRPNRIHRVNSTHGFVTFYTVRMANSVEDRVAEILEKKKGWQDSIFDGEITDSSVSAHMTAEDIYYILTGESEYDTL